MRLIFPCTLTFNSDLVFLEERGGGRGVARGVGRWVGTLLLKAGRGEQTGLLTGSYTNGCLLSMFHVLSPIPGVREESREKLELGEGAPARWEKAGRMRPAWRAWA